MKKILYGFQNEGNYCYLNSIINLLFSVKPIIIFFKNIKQINKTGILREFQNLCIGTLDNETDVIKNINGILLDDYQCLSTLGLFREMDKIYDLGLYQHDAHEILLLLLDHIHENIKQLRLIVINHLKLTDTIKEEYSIISKTFRGKTRRILTCPKCYFEKNIFENFYILSLPVSDCIQRSFDLFCSNEEIQDVKCEVCKFQGSFNLRTEFVSLPDYIIVHFKRFSFDKYLKKNDINIESEICVIKILNNVQKIKYLSSVDHLGSSAEHGHYIFNIKIPDSDKYIMVNDEDICQVDEINPYICIMTKVT